MAAVTHVQLSTATAGCASFTNKHLERLFLPTLDGKHVLNDGDPQGFKTPQAACGSARRFRNMCHRKTSGFDANKYCGKCHMHVDEPCEECKKQTSLPSNQGSNSDA